MSFVETPAGAKLPPSKVGVAPSESKARGWWRHLEEGPHLFSYIAGGQLCVSLCVCACKSVRACVSVDVRVSLAAVSVSVLTGMMRLVEADGGGVRRPEDACRPPSRQPPAGSAPRVPLLFRLTGLEQ